MWTFYDDVLFQSTLLMRGATSGFGKSLTFSCDFNPRSSCEERPGRPSAISERSIFQSTLLMRGATATRRSRRLLLLFQSTLLMRGATASVRHVARHLQFQSTLLMRGATCRTCRMLSRVACNFNPRSSCEERHSRFKRRKGRNLISIHAPHARSDVSWSRMAR